MLNLYNYPQIIAGKATASLIPAKVGDMWNHSGVQRLNKEGVYHYLLMHLGKYKFSDIHGHKENTRELVVGYFEKASFVEPQYYMRTPANYELQGFSKLGDMVNAYNQYYSGRPLVWAFRVTLCQPITD